MPTYTGFRDAPDAGERVDGEADSTAGMTGTVRLTIWLLLMLMLLGEAATGGDVQTTKSHSQGWLSRSCRQSTAG
jgi:hypothetical protein